MKRANTRESPVFGLDERLEGLARPPRSARRMRRLALAVTAGCLLVLVMTFMAALKPKAPTSAPAGRAPAPVSQPSPARATDLAEMRAAIFEALDAIGMDAGRYALDPRHTPHIVLQGGLIEVTGEVSLLNQPDRPTPYYAIIEQSGPVTSLRLLRVGDEVVHGR